MTPTYELIQVNDCRKLQCNLINTFLKLNHFTANKLNENIKT